MCNLRVLEFVDVLMTLCGFVEKCMFVGNSVCVVPFNMFSCAYMHMCALVIMYIY